MAELTPEARRRASSAFSCFLRELAKVGVISDLHARRSGRVYWGGKTHDWESKTQEEAISNIGGSGVSLTFEYEGKKFSEYFSDGDYFESDHYDQFFYEHYKMLVEEMKSTGEYYFPGTMVPYWALPSYGITIIKDEEGRSFIADPKRVIAPIESEENGFSFGKDVTGDIYAVWGCSNSAVIPSGTSIKVYKSHLLLGDNEVITKDGRKVLVKNASEIGDHEVCSADFDANDDGVWYYIPHLRSEKLLQFYATYNFKRRAEFLLRKFARERDEREKRETKRAKELADLDDFVKSSDDILIDVFFQDDNGRDTEEKDVNIYKGSHFCGIYDAEESMNCHRLYGVRVKGWRGRADQGMLINIPVARSMLRNGILHLEVPSSAMGRILGRGGETIRATKDALRKKGLSELKDIKLHPVVE